MLILSKKELDTLITMGEVLDALETGFQELKEDRCITPVRLHLELDEYQGQLLFMPAYLPGLKQCGTKIISVFPQNPSKGKPTISGSYLLVDATTGELLALIEASTLTGIRTAGASALATRYLAREDARVMGIIGTGFQAQFQVHGINTVRPLKEVWAYDVDRKKLENFSRDLAPIVHVHPAHDTREVVQHADILVTVTTSERPVFSEKDLRPGTHINAVGAYRPNMREVDAETIEQATIFVDTFDGCRTEAGDLLIPMNEGRFKWETIRGDLGDLVTGRKKGRTSSDEVTLFESVGFAMEDLVVAQKIYERAIRENQGRSVEMF
jgi:alanine dehydrogenase